MRVQYRPADSGEMLGDSYDVVGLQIFNDFPPQSRYPGWITSECSLCHDAVDSFRRNIHDRGHVHVDTDSG